VNRRYRGNAVIRLNFSWINRLRNDDRTEVIQGWIDCILAGDDSARAALLDCACTRLTRLSRKMLKDYPGVGRWEQTDDVLQNALIRLDRAFNTITPPTARDFFRLAAAAIRRELIDLARRYSGPEGIGAHHSTRLSTSGTDGRAGDRHAPADTTLDPVRLAAWTEFHRQIEDLREEDRELFDLLWYQGLTQAEAAEVLGIAERTVNRRWLAARVRLSDSLGGQLPV
jgi:RNA polymerase sigma factor (sigma-70 family)